MAAGRYRRGASAPTGGTSIAVAIRNGWVAGWENQSGSVSVLWNLRDGSATLQPEVWLPLGVNRDGDVGGQGVGWTPVILRQSGEVVRPEVPEGSGGGVEVVTRRGLAYGFVEGQAVMWQAC